jgi:integrase
LRRVRERGVQPPTINCSVSALRFFFTVTLDRPDLSRRLVLVRHPRKLPTVLSVEEVGRLLEAAPGLKYKAALGTAYGAGLRVSEVAALKAGDIDSERMLLRVEQGKGRKDRNAMLSPQLLELLRLWWREGRRRNVMLPHGWLFPGRSPVEPISTRQLNRAVHEAAEAAGIKKARYPAHVAPQLRHAPAGARCRHPRHSRPPRNRYILPANTQSRGGFSIHSIPAAARACLLSGNTPTVVLSWSSFRSLTGQSPAYPSG